MRNSDRAILSDAGCSSPDVPFGQIKSTGALATPLQETNHSLGAHPLYCTVALRLANCSTIRLMPSLSVSFNAGTLQIATPPFGYRSVTATASMPPTSLTSSGSSTVQVSLGSRTEYVGPTAGREKAADAMSSPPLRIAVCNGCTGAGSQAWRFELARKRPNPVQSMANKRSQGLGRNEVFADFHKARPGLGIARMEFPAS